MRKLLILAALVVPLCGCPMNQSQQQQVLRASDQAAIIVSAAQKAETTAYEQKLITPAEHQFIEQQFNSVGQIGVTVDNCIGNASNQGSVLICLNSAITSIDSINASGGLYLKSTQAKNDFTIAITGVRTVLASVDAALGGVAPVVAQNGGK
jgi:hypothetical protein